MLTRGGRALLRFGLAGLLAAGCATPTPRELTRGWIEVRSPNYRLTSALDEATTVEAAERLELFRQVVARVSAVRSFDSTLPAYFYLFDGESRFAPFSERHVAGYFMAEQRVSIAALAGSRDLPTLQVLFHEYTHFLLYNSKRGAAYPRWFQEGFAELMGSVRVDGDDVLYGEPSEANRERIGEGPWLSVRRVLSPDDYENWSSSTRAMFYAEAWALVHYLTTGENAKHFQKRMSRYLEARESGMPEDRAFESGFGIPVASLDDELERYLQRVYFWRIPLEKFETETRTEVRAIPAAEMGEQLGVLSLLIGRPEQAQQLFRFAIAQSPERSRSHAGLGDAIKFQGRFDEAEGHYLRALELSPEDALNELDFAQYWHDRALRTQDPEARKRLLGRAKQHYQRSFELDPTIPETSMFMGKALFDAEDEPARGIEWLERAHGLLPGNSDISFYLALRYVEQGRRADAEPLLRRLLTQEHSKDRMRMIRELLARSGAM